MVGLENTKPHVLTKEEVAFLAPCGGRDLSEWLGGAVHGAHSRERKRNPAACALPPAETAAGTGQKTFLFS